MHGKKTTNIYTQNPVCNGCYFDLEIIINFQSGCYESPLGNNIVDWFVAEVIVF